MSALQKKRISTSALMEMGYVRISEEMDLQICFDENGACPHLKKLEFPHLFGRKLDTPDPRKK